MNVRIGQPVPHALFRARRDGDWFDIDSRALFSGRRVIVFALPGAFTPTCSSSHLPRYDALGPVFHGLGIDEVVCLSVNDGFVMAAWAQAQNLRHVTMLPDGNGDFTEGMGMLVDKPDLGFGKRSWRYSMLVEDGIITEMFVEPDRPGDPFEVSDADTMLRRLAPDVALPPEVTLFSKPGCRFCLEAKALLTERGLRFEEIVLEGGISYQTLRNVTGQRTTPQVYIDGQHVGALAELRRRFELVA
jgi:glutaredoxin-like protein